MLAGKQSLFLLGMLLSIMVSTVTMKTTKSADGSNPGVQVAYLSGRYTLLLNFLSSVALEATFCKE